MSKYQEALDNVYNELRRRPCVLDSRLLKTSRPTLQELVDRAKPHKPENSYYCPNCKKDFLKSLSGFEKYCCDCGQALDWKEDEQTNSSD